MKVYLIQDIEHVGFAGEMIKVKDGYAKNYLLPRKLAKEVTLANEHLFAKRVREVENRKQALESKTSMMAEKINQIELTLKRKMHDDGKLYGAVGAHEIVELLAEKGIKVSKNQVIFGKSIKERGTYDVKVKLSNTLKPQVSLKVMAE
jgi:large subunit ribosomal protein L9